MLFAYWLIIGSLFGAASGLIAIGRNRSAVGWWATGVVLGPLGLALLYSKPHRAGERPAML